MRRALSFVTIKLRSFKPILLPFLLAIYPSLFHYGNNARIVTLASLERALLFYCMLALVFYVVFFVFMKRRPVKTAYATFVFLIFFNLYGVAYNYLLHLDIIPVEDYTLLPLFLLTALYASWFISKVSSDRLWKTAVFLLGILTVFNLSKILPAEAAIYKISNQENASAPSIEKTSMPPSYPDIYFIIFDEFAGFDSMRNYWHYQGVDVFAQFLKSKGFFVAEASHSSSIDTLHQMSERLNYQEYPSNVNPDIYYDAIVNNRAMDYLKSLEYTTVVFDEKKFGYPAMPSMLADYSFEYDSLNVNKTNVDMGILFDEFGILVADNTMLRAFSLFYNQSVDPIFKKHQDMVYFTAMKLSDLDEISSPKFVHVHLLLPHYPFMFSENGSVNDPLYYYNWNNYLGNYKFTINLAEKMVSAILENTDPVRLPIIILQSDHGARNETTRHGIQLEDFPEEYKTDILFAMYIPEYDYFTIPQDVDPINTFPIVFNYLFDDNIPLK